MIRRSSLFLALAAVILSACGPNASISSSNGRIVLASTSILADLARNVAGDRVEVEERGNVPDCPDRPQDQRGTRVKCHQAS